MTSNPLPKETRDLISELEEAKEGSRELDAALGLALDPALADYEPSVKYPDGAVQRRGEPGWIRGVVAYTTSVDAILALIEKRLPEANCCGFDKTPVEVCGYVSRNNVRDGHWLVEAYAATPPLALCKALLTALQKENPHD